MHYKRIAVAGAASALSASSCSACWSQGASLLTVEVLTFGTGLGAGTTFPVGSISVQNAVSRADLGVATGVLTFLRSLGGACGVAALGAVALGFDVSAWPGRPSAAGGHRCLGRALRDHLPDRRRHHVPALVMLVVMPEKKLQGHIEDAPATGRLTRQQSGRQPVAAATSSAKAAIGPNTACRSEGSICVPVAALSTTVQMDSACTPSAAASA